MNPTNQPYIISHAQNREDIILSGFFKGIDKGFYVDVGANDPAIDSVTKYFYERSWNGINVEPIKKLYIRLEEARPRDINLNIGISDQKGALTFREYKEFHGLSTFAEKIYNDYDSLAKVDNRYEDYIERSVPIKTLADVFEENEVSTIHFMKVDVEGYEYNVLKSNNWERFRPQVICVEANHIDKDWRPILKKAKYELVFFDGLNNYYVAEEASEARSSFSYVQTMLPTPIVDYRVVGVIEYYKKGKMVADTQNTVLNNEIHRLKHQLYMSELELAELSRLRGLIKALFRKINVIIEQKIVPSNEKSEPVILDAGRASLIIQPGLPSEQIFKAIREYDARFLPQLNPPNHRLRFVLLRIYRRLILKGLRSVIKHIYKRLRKLNEIRRKV